MIKGKRIFVIEDDPNNLAIISAILRRGGATVHFDLWGYETADRITNLLPIDVILLDLMLPGGVSGYDIFRELHTRPELRSIPIVAVTAMDPTTELRKAKEMGFAGFLCKPIRTTTFAKYLTAILDGTQVWIDLE